MASVWLWPVPWAVGNRTVTSDLFAALSAVLTHLFLLTAIGLVYVLWRDRRRFAYWREMGPRGRADTLLNFGMAGFMAIAGYHRGLATYNFAVKHWAAATPASDTAAIYLPLHLMFAAVILWWLAIELCGVHWAAWAWSTVMAIGFVLGVAIMLAF